MQDAGVSSEYCHGWATGALGNPALEEQRITEDYNAGYDDGKAGVTDGFKKWVSES